MLFYRLEEAAMSAWPARQQALYGGWVLRFSDGYTKRSNSVTPLYTLPGSDDLSLEERIAFCEARYHAQGLPPRFRLPEFCAPSGLDDLLAARGYRQIDMTLVETCDLHTAPQPDVPVVEFRAEALDDWLTHFSVLKGSPLGDHDAHRALLAQIVARPLFATARVAGQVVACGLAVADGRTCGLFDFITAADARNRGYGSALLAHMLDWARAQDASTAYLQVVRANAVARHVYEGKFGFEQAYRYWYRVP